MKKIILAGSMACAIMSTAALSSCNSWIEEDPKGQTTIDKVGDSDDAAATWVTGVYSKLIYDMFCWGYFPKVLEFDADYISGPDWLFGTFGVGNFQGESDLTDALWKGCYGLISRSNTALLNVGAMNNTTPDVKNNAIGELKFLRAFGYFLLVRAYGDLPIQPEQATSDYNLPRQPLAKIYDYITTDLEEAATLLYKNTDRNYQAGHVSAGSAAALLAKVYATQASAAMPAGTEITVRTGKTYNGSGDNRTYAPLQKLTFAKEAVSGYEGMDSKALYAKAAEWAGRVVDGEFGTYELLPYDKLWKKAYCNASEFMFSVNSVSGDATYKMSVHMQYDGCRTEAGSEFTDQGGWVGCTRHWYDLFEDTDLRIVEGVKHRWRVKYQRESNSGFYYPHNNAYCIAATGYDLNGNKVGEPTGVYADGVSYYYSMDSQCLAFTTKYSDVTNNAISNADANWPFLRYADLKLIYAEALNELDDNRCIEQLNDVRRRSNASEAYLSGGGALDTKVKRRSAIIEERAKELACEADRRWDLIRWGIYLQAMNAIEGSDDCGVLKTRQRRNLLYPIPVPELNTNNAINENNPGWN